MRKVVILLYEANPITCLKFFLDAGFKLLNSTQTHDGFAVLLRRENAFEMALGVIEPLPENAVGMAEIPADNLELISRYFPS